MQKKFRVEITTHAQQDIGHIYDYIAADSVRHAYLFISELENRIALLDLFPERHPRIRENKYLATDYHHLIFQRYRIIYRIAGSVVYIVRVIHGAHELQ